MSYLSSPSRRKSNYSTTSMANHPPPAGAPQDTSIQIATAINLDRFEQDRSRYRHENDVYLSPHRHSLYQRSTSSINNTINNSSNYSSLLDTDNEMLGKGQKSLQDLQQPSSLSQSSSSDDELDNPFLEEERLANDPYEEKHRRQLAKQRSDFSERYDNGSFTTSSVHSFHSDQLLTTSKNSSFTKRKTVSSDRGDNDNDNEGDTHSMDASAIEDSMTAGTSPPPSMIKYILDVTFQSIMFWIFVAFWVVKEVAAALFTSIFMIISTLLVNPLLFLLRCIGFTSLQPVTLSSIRSLAQPSNVKRNPIITLFFVGLLIIFSTHYGLSWQEHLSTGRLLPFSLKDAWPSPTSSSFDWLSTHAISTSNENNKGNAKEDGQHDALMMKRFTALEKTVQGIVQHIESQDQASQQQMASIRYHLDKLQDQLSLWTTTQSKEMEATVERQMDKVERALARQSEEWNSQLQDIKKEQQGEPQAGGITTAQLVDALRQVFTQKDGEEIWRHLDQHLQEKLDQWVEEEQIRDGRWLDKEALMEQFTKQWEKDGNEGGSLSSETMQVLRHMVDSAIQRYHQDVLDTPDYALATRGAMILSWFTSPTLSLEDATDTNWVTRWYSQWSQPYLSPIIALTPGTHVGQCWPMKGDYGSLGIKLSEPVAVKAVTVEYPSRSVMKDMSSAPKRMEIWGLKSVGNSNISKKNTIEYLMDGNDGAGDDNVIFLGHIMYDIHASPLQTFNLDTHGYIVLEGVIVRIRSNWGNNQYTCLYRVRVHGTPAI